LLCSPCLRWPSPRSLPAQVKPGATVQFAAGTYLVGEIIPIATPGLTLLGHPDGTTLRACEAEDFAGVGDVP
jgi:hypothetical protein